MRRVFFAILLWIVLVGGLAAYMRHRDAKPVERSPGRVVSAAGGVYSLEVTPTFMPGPDAFALRLEGEPVPAPLSARLRGREILRRAGGIAAGVPVVVENMPGVVAGDNEIVIAATPPVDAAGRRNYVQARVFRNGVPVADETFWAEGAARVGGVLRFTAPAGGGEASDDGE